MQGVASEMAKFATYRARLLTLGEGEMMGLREKGPEFNHPSDMQFVNTETMDPSSQAKQGIHL